MAQDILFLHSSCDTRELQDLERQAASDLRDTDWRIWIDASAYTSSLATSATLSAAGPLDDQIRSAIADAFAIVFVVGSTGPGAYQSSREVPWILEALQARLSTQRPLRFVPVLLREGRESHLTDWMLQYPVVNKARNLTHLNIWREIFRRINEESPQLDPGFSPIRRPPEVWATIEAIADTLGDPPCLTVLIGPYGDQRAGDAGPAMLTERLLRRIDLSANAFQPWLPWPSESAEWVRLGLGPHAVDGLFTGREFAQVSQNPPDLLLRVARLARAWSDRHGSRQTSESWSGLVLLNTRVDLGLEYALHKEGVRFTRLTPTARNNDKALPKLFQSWRPGANWMPCAGLPSPATNLRVRIEGGAKGLAKLSLDEADPVLLVKVFGSLDIDGSLVATAADLFKEATGLLNMPKEMVEALQASPQVLVGSGLASPVAQLARQFVLGERNKRKPRVLVVPRAPAAQDDKAPADSLIELEQTLLDRFADKVREAMDLESICWSDPIAFIDDLAENV